MHEYVSLAWKDLPYLPQERNGIDPADDGFKGIVLLKHLTGWLLNIILWGPSDNKSAFLAKDLAPNMQVITYTCPPTYSCVMRPIPKSIPIVYVQMNLFIWKIFGFEFSYICHGNAYI